MAKDFKSRSAPLDGIGLQMHINLSFNEPKTLNSFVANLKRFNDLGMDIHVTEFDVAPAPAVITSRSRACATVLTGLVNQVAQIFSSLPMLPSQLSFLGS